jgi:hypothetical protein
MAPPEHESIDIGTVEYPDLRPSRVFAAYEKALLGVPTHRADGEACNSGDIVHEQWAIGRRYPDRLSGRVIVRLHPVSPFGKKQGRFEEDFRL